VTHRDTSDIRDVQGAGQVVDHCVQQGLHTLVLEGGTAHHGHKGLGDGALADQALDGVVVGHGALKVSLQHL